MAQPRQDPDTGRVFINGKLGQTLEWLRWGAALLMLPICVYLLVHYSDHDQIEKFMQVGPRFTGTKELPNADALRRAVLLDTIREIAEHREGGAHPGIDARVAALEKAIERQDKKLDEILRRLPR